MTPREAILHNFDEPIVMRFPFLAGALNHAWKVKATGYIVTPNDEVINLRKGKRKGIRKGWVPCNVGVEDSTSLPTLKDS